MDVDLSEILHLAVPLFGGESRFLVADKTASQEEAKAIVRALPLMDRLQLYALLLTSKAPEIANLSPANYRKIILEVGSSISLKDDDFLQMAIQAATGKKQLREKTDIPANDKFSFDGFQNAPERLRQTWLASLLTDFLPTASGITPTEFVSQHLSETQHGIALALLSVPRDPEDEKVSRAKLLLCETAEFRPAVWSGLKTTCQNLVNGSQDLAALTTSFCDSIVETAIFALDAHAVSLLDDKKALKYVQALTYTSIVTDSFTRTRRHLFENLSPSQNLTELRDQQIDTFVVGFAELPQRTRDQWQTHKENWSRYNYDQKAEALNEYVVALGQNLGLPQSPQAIVTSWGQAPDKPSGLSNGYYAGFSNIPDGTGKTARTWTNKVYLIDDVDANGSPLSTARTLRASLSTATHETLHSADQQAINTLHSNEDYKLFSAALTTATAPEVMKHANPIWQATQILAWTKNTVTVRGNYVPAEKDFDTYRHQPFEKNAWSFQNQFTAALNGSLVAHQVETNTRVLHHELNAAFQKISRVLTAREQLTGNSSDLIPLKNYVHAEHPFGSLTARDGEVADASNAAEMTGSYVAVDFLQFSCKVDVLTHLQEALDKQAAGNITNDKDLFPLLSQSADFLIQLPSELWAIKRQLGEEDKALAGKLDGLAIKTQALGEDITDYLFVTTRKTEITARLVQTQSEEQATQARRQDRQKIVSNLTATL